MRWRRLIRRLAAAIATVLLGGFLSVVLIRAAPGYGFDERELDPRLRADSIHAIRASGKSGIVRFYFDYLRAAARGDLGVSRALNRPVAELFAQRLPVTLRAMALGLALSWGLAFLLTVAAICIRHPAVDLIATLFSGATLALPSAVVALLCLLAGWPPAAALAIVVFPRIFRYLRSIVLETLDQPYVLLAAAKGLGTARILLRHVLPAAAPRIAALAGVSVSLAFGALIPIEVVCDSPGFGHLAWQAAQGRDLPLLVNITLLVTLVTLVANSVGEATA